MVQSSFFVDLSHLGLLSVSGEGAKKLLQGQLTCNLDDITPESHRLSAICNPKGRIISLFRLFMLHDKYYLQMPRECVQLTIKTLQKYAVFFKVTIQDESDSIMRIGVSDTDLSSTLLVYFPTLPTEVDQAVLINNIFIMKLPGLVTRYEIIGDLAAFKQELALSIHEKNYSDWKQQDIRAGVPDIYLITSEKFLPHEVNLPQLNAVSFNKGCYTGQEIIARMHYLGKLKKQMHHGEIQSATSPIPGEDIINPEGTIVDFVEISDNQYEILYIS